MIRTIATALVGFDPVFDRGLKVIAWDDLREWGKALCSTGTSLEILKEALKGKNVLFFISVHFLSSLVFQRSRSRFETFSLSLKSDI